MSWLLESHVCWTCHNCNMPHSRPIRCCRHCLCNRWLCCAAACQALETAIISSVLCRLQPVRALAFCAVSSCGDCRSGNAVGLNAAVYSSRMRPRPIRTAAMKLLLMLLTTAGVTATAALVLLRVMGGRMGSAGVVSLKTGSGAGGGGAGGANFMFWRQPQPPKKMPFATASPHTSMSTTSRVWFALSVTLRFRGDSQCSCEGGAVHGCRQYSRASDGSVAGC